MDNQQQEEQKQSPIDQLNNSVRDAKIWANRAKKAFKLGNTPASTIEKAAVKQLGKQVVTHGLRTIFVALGGSSFLLIIFILIMLIPPFAGTGETAGVPSDFLPPGTGNNPAGVLIGWPTNGVITQGPRGTFNHYQTPGPALDIANPSSPIIYGSFEGVVEGTHVVTPGAPGPGGYGNQVLVRSKNGLFSVLYAHFKYITVSKGDTIQRGTPLGIMGTTGKSSGTHLHWEFRGGISMTPPNIPTAITPSNCNPPSIPCSPSSISY